MYGLETTISLNAAKVQQTRPVPATSFAQRIFDFEAGRLDREETIDLFQGLIDTGLAWSLQGFYGRIARDLIDSGLCHE